MIKKINKKLVKRYLKLLKSKEHFGKNEYSKTHLVKMLKMMLKTKDFTEDKHSRWLGYVQGILVVYNIIDVSIERKFSRKLYQKYYKKNGIKQKKLSA